MAKTPLLEAPLDQKIEEGLSNFRAIGARPPTLRDGPFGPPPEKPSQNLRKEVSQVENIPPPLPQAATVVSRAESQSSRLKPVQSEELESEPTGFDEPVTLPLPTELRERAEKFARTLNRSRTVKKERLSRNAVTRVALEWFLDEFSLAPGEAINSEKELLIYAKSRKKRR